MTFEEWWEQVEAYGLGLPEGYVLVPVEPVDTVDKIDNIITLLKSSEYNGADLMTAWLMLRRYKDMIQAAQEEE